MKPSYLDEQFGDRLTKLLKLKSRNKQLEILSDIYEEAEANLDYDDHEDAIQEYREELKDKINSGLNDINTNETILKLRKGKAKEYWSGVIRGLNDCLKLLEKD